MEEVFTEMTTWYHLPLTIVMGFLFLYWVLSALGVVGEGLDLDLGGDLEADHGVGHDVDGGHSGTSEALLFFLRFLNMDRVPTIVVISILIPVWWFASMFANHFANPAAVLATGFLILGGMFILSTLVTKLATAPLARAISRMREKNRESSDPIVGRTGTVRSGSITATDGQVEIAMRGEPLIIHARVRDGAEPLPKGAQCVVSDQESDSDIFYVTSFEKASLEKPST